MYPKKIPKHLIIQDPYSRRNQRGSTSRWLGIFILFTVLFAVLLPYLT